MRRLRRLVAETQGARLPALAKLSRAWHVSMPALLKAAGLLRDEGVLLFGRGRAPIIVGRLPPPPPPAPPPADRLCGEIEARIGGGEWKAGQPLPKIAWFTLTYGVSDHTVRTAFRRLERRGILHQRGKRRLVGPAPALAPEVAAAAPRFILILQQGWADWQWLFKADRTEEFASVFYQEAGRYGVELLPAIAEAGDAANNRQRIYLDGPARIARHIAAHRDRYLGALLCSSRYGATGADAWARRLLAYERPVVWFDGDMTGAPCPVEHRLFARLTMDERRVADCAAQALAAFGHRRVVYPFEPDVAWQAARLRWLGAAAPSGGWTPAAIAGVALHPAPPLLPRALRDRLCRRLESLVEPDERAAVGARLDALLRDPSGLRNLAEALADPACTAVCAPCDRIGQMLYGWLAALGVRLGDTFSLLSFDNYRSFRALPMTSINFGFGRLGYLAFHAILRDLPITRGRDATILAEPFVCHRGSFGPRA